MRTSIIGYPRVGSLRELKFATEKYFRKEISAEELKNTGKGNQKITVAAPKEFRTGFYSVK